MNFPVDCDSLIMYYFRQRNPLQVEERSTGTLGMKSKKRISEKKSRVMYPNITMNAGLLGCSRQHLYMVLKGKRVSRRLTTRYNELVGEQR